MKLIKFAVTAAVISAIASGCAAEPAAVVTESSGTEVVAVTEETAAAISAEETTASEKYADVSSLTPEEYRSMIVERSLLTMGDTSRIESVIRRARSGEDITVAYIGGSITEGLTAGADKCWARLSYERLCAAIPEAGINYVNAGMSGTPSELGVIRAERDVIAPYGAPDIVFIEFAVNNAQDELSKNTYESLVRRMLSQKEDTAVILLFTVLKNGYSCEDAYMRAVGEHYGLPMISVGAALNEEFASERTPWEQYSDDESHPNEWGHQLVCDFVMNCFSKALDGADTGARPGDISGVAPLYGADYTDVSLLDRTNLTPVSLGEYLDDKDMIAQFPNGWMRKGGDNEGITFEIECKDLFVIYHCNKSAKFGTADVYVDGELSASVNSSDESGWSNPVAQLIYRGDEAKRHTVQFRMREGHEDSYFGILGFGCCK